MIIISGRNNYRYQKNIIIKVVVGIVFGLLKLIGEPVPGSWSTPTLSAVFRIGTKEGARKSTNLSGWFVTEKTAFGCLS